jgi:hypothetical protein
VTPLAAGSGSAAEALGIVVGMTLVMVLSLTVPYAMSGKRTLPPGLGALLAGHTEFLLLGLLLGPAVLNWFDGELLGQMQPFLTVALGWVGLIFGIQWDWLKVKRFPRGWFFVSAAQAITAFVCVAVVMLLSLRVVAPMRADVFGDLSRKDTLTLATLLGVACCATAPIGIGWMITARGLRGKNTDLAQFMAATDGIVGVVLLGAVLSALRPSTLLGGPGLGMLGNVALSLCLGVALGWLAHFILRGRWNAPDYVVWLIGLVVFSSGAAHVVGQSPLVINFIMGAVFVNLSHQSERVTKSLEGAEVPFYIIFLLLAGASWPLHLGWQLLLVVPLALSRALGKVLGYMAARRRWHVGFDDRRDLGLAMLSQGGLALAMVIDVGLLVPDSPVVRVFVSLAILVIVLNQMIAPALAAIPLRGAGEIRRG